MKKRIENLYYKHKDFIKEIFLYGIFGFLTTVISYGVYVIASNILPINTVTVPTAISWVAGVLFSYFTNRKWVFEKKHQTKKEEVKEFYSFVLSRVFSLIVDLIIMFVFVDVLHNNEYIIKILSNIVVIILNYIFSKLFVFKKEGK